MKMEEKGEAEGRSLTGERSSDKILDALRQKRPNTAGQISIYNLKRRVRLVGQL